MFLDPIQLGKTYQNNTKVRFRELENELDILKVKVKVLSLKLNEIESNNRLFIKVILLYSVLIFINCFL
jgi:hypothetical protein